MNALIAAVAARGRSVLIVFLLLVLAGAYAYSVIPKEAAPDIDIPIFFINVVQQGLSPADAERLLVRPLERVLQPLAGLRDITAYAGEGFGLVQLEFDPQRDNRTALEDVRAEVDQVLAELPPGAERPHITEVDLTLFPVLSVILSGPTGERVLQRIARQLEDRLEALPGVLEVDIGGEREHLMEILADPMVMVSYGIGFDELAQAVRRNNQLVAAGAADTGTGRVAIRIPELIEGAAEVLDTVVRESDGAVVRVRDIAEVRETFEDPQGFARVDGQPAIALEVRKQVEANVIDLVQQVRATVDEAARDWPAGLQVTFLQDQAEAVQRQIGDMENAVVVAVILVMLVALAALSVRASLLVALAVLGSFLTSILLVSLLGFTLNIVVMFGFILVIGLLVDGAVVVVELADRYLAAGVGGRQAYVRAAQRMAWPITTGAATTVAAFVPMLLWPGVAGQFMLYIPATVIVTLVVALLMALLVIPTLGTLLPRGRRADPEQQAVARALEEGHLERVGRFTRGYVAVLRPAVAHPLLTVGAALVLMMALYTAYAALGRGVEFFPRVDPDFLQMQVQARGNLSVREADALVQQVERRVLGVEGVRAVYARTHGEVLQRVQANVAQDVVGVLQLELHHWRVRPPGTDIVAELRRLTADIPGVRVQVREQQGGPQRGKPIVVQLSGADDAAREQAVRHVRALMAGLGGFIDVEDDRPLPGVDVRVVVDREAAARHGADIAVLGQAVQMITRGVPLDVYRPAHTDEEVDIRLRYPPHQRSLHQLAQLQVPTARGLVPAAHFIEFQPVPAQTLIQRLDGTRANTVEADAAPDELPADLIDRLRRALAQEPVPEGVHVAFRGQAEDQAEVGAFLPLAALTALFLMVLILVTQFNSVFQALLVLSAIVFSTAGVLLGLLLRGEPFGLIMSGIGVLALAGIVVNNNIVLLDTYNALRGEGLAAAHAAVRAGAQRLRPVLLTSATTAAGLMPMVLGLTVDIPGRDIYFGAPSTQYWMQLATAVVGGLVLAAPLTLLVTPAAVSGWDRWRERRRAAA
ncbi:efflux RND transporter permease subunit [Ectothiorhodospiraceae bacterium 2226]|nr:efflux RND transporter permease subunit [Ectothiorhodospiraceae bacterium 2226]